MEIRFPAPIIIDGSRTDCDERATSDKVNYFQRDAALTVSR